MGTEEGPSIPCSTASITRLPLSSPFLVQRRASQDTGTPKLGSFLSLQREHRTTTQNSSWL